MRILVALFFLTVASITNASENEAQTFELIPQKRPYIYSVAIYGEDRWYQLEWSAFENGTSVTKTCDVFFDAISRNFYCTIGETINIIPINQPYKLKYKNKQHE